MQLRAAFPGAPVYLALGNNDSGCMDYRETPKSAFLASVATSFAGDLRDAANRTALLNTFPEYGDYSVVLPAPMRHARLIVLQDIFASAHFEGCDGKVDAEPAKAQANWLRMQLTAARAAGEQVWVMLHIPPGVDVYTSFHRYLFAPGEACSVSKPTMFLKNAALGDTIAEFSDVVRLAIFAHTHMDEIKLLTGADDAAVAAKLVPSISPVNGNDPAFLVAQVSAQTATLKDYTVYAAANAQGTGWTREYRYSAVYGLPDFSAASVRKLTDGLVADKTGEDETSRAYERLFMAGGGTFAALGLQRLWPAYSCSLREMDPAKFHSCMCPAGAAAAPTAP
jgi:sphingomyelin phosphodiesterase acid-like 3